jgi:subtilisin family serine protease
MIGWQSELESCQAGLRIGMIDTGIDVDHPAFAGGAMVVKSFSPTNVAEESHAHATGVAALIIGNGRDSTPGLLPKSRLVAADVFYLDTKKNVITDTASLLRALEWLEQSGVGIVNMSFSGPEDRLIAEAIDRMSAKGIVFVAAAGNNGPGAPAAFPAAYANVVAVTAVDSRMKSYIKANHGSYIDVAAPGVKIWTATAGGKSGYQSGTSFAVPFVTAALAASQAFGTPSSAETWLTQAGIDDLGEPGTDAVFGRGLLKAPASCAAPSIGSDLLTALLPSPISTTETARSSLGMAQR